jgi:hypothetical protein
MRQGDGPAIQQYLARIGLVNAGQALDERGFAAPVCANQGMDLAGY